MLVVPPTGEPVLLDFFVAAPGHGADLSSRAPLVAVDVSFGDVVQVFHIGAASVGAYGTPAGVCEAAARFGTVPLADLAAPAARLARDGVEVNAQQAYLFEILAAIYSSTPEGRALFMRGGADPARRRRAAQPRAGGRPRAAGGRGGVLVLLGRRRCPRLRLGDGAGRRAHPRGPRRLPRRAARAGAGPLPRARRAHQPAAQRRRHAAGLRARSAGAGRRPAWPGGAGGSDGARPGGADAGVPERAGRAGVPRALHGVPARLDHPHLGARRRGLGVHGDVHERRGLRDRRARDRACTSTT